MRRLVILGALAVGSAMGSAACSSEEATPIDLTAGPSTTSPPSDPDGAGSTLPPTPHAVGENPQARAYAEQQCRDDPGQAEGVIRIVDPTTDEVVGEVVVDCDEVRAADAEG